MPSPAREGQLCSGPFLQVTSCCFLPFSKAPEGWPRFLHPYASICLALPVGSFRQLTKAHFSKGRFPQSRGQLGNFPRLNQGKAAWYDLMRSVSQNNALLLVSLPRAQHQPRVRTVDSAGGGEMVLWVSCGRGGAGVCHPGLSGENGLPSTGRCPQKVLG